MSAFIVSQKHIEYLATAWVDYQSFQEPMYWDKKQAAEALRVANVLNAANHKSVAYRYSEPDQFEAQIKPVKRAKIEPLQVIKAVHCFEYQSCEANDWEASEAKRICSEIVKAASGKLPGYDDLAWGID